MIEPAILEELRSIVGPAHASVAEAERDLHSHDESDQKPSRPDAVVWPATTAEVAEIAKLANAHRIPIVGWGAGTSVEGHTVPVHGGIVVDFRRMNRVLAVHSEDFQAVVQPGVLRLELERHLREHGLFFAPDPGANASIGGMIANNAAGIRAIKYGATKHNVLALEVVLASGEIIRTGSRSVKQSAGYDLTQLIVGSEGTLGLITEATIKLVPVPEQFAAATIAFPDVPSAAATVQAIIGYGLGPAALELLHQDHIALMNEEEDAGLTVAPSLMVEFTGASEPEVVEAMTATREIAEANGATGFSGGIGHEARAAMWRLRHGTRERVRRRYPGRHWLSMDVAVPISAYPTLIEFTEQACGEAGFEGRVIGHAGDGNLHMGMHYDPGDPDAARRAQAVGDAIVEKALELGGTCSGEHGIGLGKRKYMVTEHGAGAVELMRTIKNALDPNGILNPGKILP